MAATTQGKGDNLLKYAVVAASTLRDIAESSQTPFLRTIAGVSISILTIVQSVKSNKDVTMRLVSGIDQLLSVILQLSVKGDELSPEMLHNMGKFADTLQKIYSFVKAQQSATVLKRIFRQSENAALLEECNLGLRNALTAFGVETSLVVATGMAEMRELAEKRHQELIQLFQSDASDSDTSSLVSKSLFLFELGNSTTSLVLLPPTPKIFHGRESELDELVELLLQSPARVTILGPGGIGKTSLAVTALHRSEIVARYTERYFVSCESAATHEDLVAIIASHVGVAPTRNTSKQILNHLSNSPPSILLLDNLETCWEPLSSRSQVEQLLGKLTDIPQLALMITMRGAERPQSVRWTRPFLPPLEPLSDDAARKTFADITDEELGDIEVRQLLEVTDNVPLAVSLVASMATFEGYETVLSRWKEEKTTLFSGGADKRSNLDLSIRISLSSPRMLDSPGAHLLLSLLSLLPDGISDADLFQSGFPITDMGRSKATLLRTALAYIDHDRRLRVLAPIREYIRNHHPPPSSLSRPLRQHFHRLILLWKDYQQHLSTANINHRIAANAGNFHSVLTHGLNWDEPDLKETLNSIITFDSFSRISGKRSSGMLELLPGYLDRLTDHRLHAEYLTVFVLTWQYHPRLDMDSVETAAIQHLRAMHDKCGEAKFLCAAASYFQKHDNNIPKALGYFETAFKLASEAQDAQTQCLALRDISQGLCVLGRYPEARVKAREMRALAQRHGLLYMEAHAIRADLFCRVIQGDLASCLALSAEGRALLALCGLEGSTLDLVLLNSDAEVHLTKTEYAEARALYAKTRADQAPHPQAYDRLNLALIDTEIGVDSTQVRQDMAAVRATFESLKIPVGIIVCEVIHSYIDIRDGFLDNARRSLERAFIQTRGENQEISILCLTKLADITCGLYDASTTLGWACVLMAFARKGNIIAVYHALRCLGDVFLVQGEEETALSLLDVSLAGFTAADIHRGRAECMLRMGDLFDRRGNGERAIEFWRMARPLFVRSLQAKEVAQVDERLHPFS
ncbi:hypothetical protein B0H16DRAFT_416054 [Mycena metata]|uniref:Novel STAND NTPase 1 domain-containing protein n=1 Tax=Mycena metata TaxID=1033252 RepID=A0AAD7JIQ5_9AGAR|nr:hypothetical protein B0H16DRAFT_416054 [Mycena metata]